MMKLWEPWKFTGEYFGKVRCGIAEQTGGAF
jgi:hypothetical protein